MTVNLTRRTALAGAAALPLAPAAAIGRITDQDPVLAAVASWDAMRKHYEATLAEFSRIELGCGVESPEAETFFEETLTPTEHEICEFEGEIAAMVPTTVAGMAAQLRVLAYGGGYLEPVFDDSKECRFVRSLLTAAERISESPS